MRYALYVIAAIIAWSALLNVASVGKPRKPTTPTIAVGVVVLNAAVVVVLILAAGQVTR